MTKKANMKRTKDNKTIYYYENYIIEMKNKDVLIKNK